MKKLLKENIKTFITIIITTVVASVTTIFAYSLVAGAVGYTPHDTTWNVENVEAALNNLNLRTNQLDTHFSTEEQVVGEWIDNRPVYQLTVNGLNSKMTWTGANYTYCSIPAPVQNVERVLNARAYMSGSSNGFVNWSEVAAINIVSSTATTWTITSLEDYYLRGYTIQYIKTTD